MTPLISMKFGSHLYGTSTPKSDMDFKGVHLPDAKSILLGRVAKVIQQNTSDGNQKNTADDVDRESYNLKLFLELAAEGQTVALDMLFAPEWAWTMEAHPTWLEILANKDRLLTNKYLSFVGYCRTQANRYGVRGERLAAAKAALALLEEAIERYGPATKLKIIHDEITALTLMHEHMELIDIPNEQLSALTHWNVCNRKMVYTASLKIARDLMARVVAEYGHRARAAETNAGVDWKAVSHAVRIGRQSIEFLQTGNVIFPRPDAVHILAVKMGALPYEQVSDEIDQLLVDIEAAAASSSLRNQPDQEWIDDFVYRNYRDVVMLT